MKVARTNRLAANHSVDQLFNLCKRIDGDSSTNVERWNFATRSHGATIKSDLTPKNEARLRVESCSFWI